MLISIVICTYNRCESLKDTLESLTNQNNDKSFDYEIIVVDNNSKDNTKYVVERFRYFLNSKLKYIFEARQGKSYALNSGLNEANGEIIVFTDDDVIASPSWLKNINTAFINNNCIGMGGKVIPRWPLKAPSWFEWRGKYSISGPVAVHDYGDEPLVYVADMCVPIGANMAYRKSAFERFGYFNISIGRKGNCLGGSEDVEFGKRLLSANEKIVYYPDALVSHIIIPERTNKKYFRKWYFEQGRINFHRYIGKDNPVMILGIPRYLFRQLASYINSFLFNLFTFRLKARFYYELKYLLILGQITGWIIFNRDSHDYRN